MEWCDGAELLRPAWRGLFSNNRTSGCLLFLLYSNKLKSVKKKQKENSIVDYFPSAAWSRVIHYVLFVLSWCSSPRNVPPSFQIVCLNCVLKSTLRPFFPARQIWSMSNWRYWNVRSSNVHLMFRQGYDRMDTVRLWDPEPVCSPVSVTRFLQESRQLEDRRFRSPGKKNKKQPTHAHVTTLEYLSIAAVLSKLETLPNLW